MAYRKTSAAAAVTSAATTVLGTIELGSPYATVLGFDGANWASSAKAAEGTDAAEKVKLTDADGYVLYLDAADRDYGATSGPTPSTNGTRTIITPDETTTGLSHRHVDATGTALAADTGGTRGVFARSPVTVEVQNAGTATDYFEVSLLVDTG